MRVLLAQNMLYVPSHGGANKASRIVLEELAAQGHDCHVVAPMTAAHRPISTAELVAYLERHGVRPQAVTPEAVRFTFRGVRAHLVVEPRRLAPHAVRLAADVDPDWTLVPCDDPGLLMLGAALHATPGRVVYLAYTLQQLPFGPRSLFPSATAARLVRRAAGVVTLSRAAQAYLRRWGGVDATVFHAPVYGSEPYPRHGRPDAGAVTMVNPCAVKGVSVFLGLADAYPDVSFLAVPTWGTTAADRAALARRANVRTVDPADDVDEILARTRVLLMPSLWDETFGFTCVEAMLRGVPVLAADVGGLAEAKLGVPYLLPVRPIRRYAARDGQPQLEPVVPEQDLGPWQEALGRLLGDPAHYQEVAERSRAAAHAFAGGLDPGAFAGYLTTLRRRDPGASLTTRSGARAPARRRR